MSGNKADKSKLFEVFYGELRQAPLITACSINIECRLVQSVELPTNTFFIGEIVNIHCDEQCLVNGKPDVHLARPFLLTMPDNRFWAVGEQVGTAWKDGVKYKETMR